MSERYIWKESFKLGIHEVDAEHRAFLDVLNAVADAHDRGDRDRLQRALRDLRKYAEIHFAHEEAFLSAAGYPALSRQRLEHAYYIRRLDEMTSKGDLNAVLSFARNWAIEHILGSDREYARWVHAHAAAPEAPGPHARS